jgi:hypothetical protein
MAQKIGQALIQEKKLTERQLAIALQRQVTLGGRLGTNLVELGFLTDTELTQALGRHLKMTPAQPEVFDSIPLEVIHLVPQELAQKYTMVPFRKEGRTLCIAMADPSELAALDELTFVIGCTVQPFLASESKIHAALETYYGLARPRRYVSLVASTAAGSGTGSDGAVEDDETEQTLPTIENFEHGLKPSYEELVHATQRDEIVAVLLREFSRVADHVLFFAVAEARVIGLMARGGGYAMDDFLGMEIRLDQSPLLRQAVEKQEPVIQLFAPEALGSGLADLLRRYQPRQIAAFPLMAAGQVVGIFYADKQQVTGAFPYVDLLQQLTAKGGMMMEVLILKKKILEL